MVIFKHIPIIFLLFACLSCNEKQQGRLRPSVLCPYPKKIAVYKDNVYDLNGYADEGNGDPFCLFDENALVDPANDPDGSYKPHTNPQPAAHPGIYFPAGKGNRIVIDLGATGRLTDAWLYDRSNSPDSVWLYVGDMLHWKLKAAFTAISYFESSRWRRVPLDDSSRYVMIRFSSYKTAITEMVLYGCAGGAGAQPPSAAPPSAASPSAAPKDPPFTRKAMKEFLGVNDYSAVDAKWLKPFYYSRMYSFAVDFDRDTINRYPDVQYNMTHFGYWDNSIHDYHYGTEDNVKQNHHVVWYTMQGLPLWMAKDEKDKKGRPVTQWGMDPEDPRSYVRHSAMMWTLAAWFGHTKRDTNLLSLDHRPRTAGRGTMQLYENGNEEDAFWTGERYCDPMDYFAQSSADYDGAEGALGARCGIHNADSSSALITSGLISLDTNRIRVYKFLCNTLRKDKAFIWKGGVQYHHYSSDGRHGISPEEDSLRWRLAKVKSFTDRLEPGIPCILGENGYDKSQRTRQATPLLPGLSPEECQAVFILRSINATAFSGFDSYILYWFKDNNPADDANVYLTSGVVRQMPDGSIQPYPSWFYISTLENRLGNYRPDQIVSEKGNVWVYKYRNVLSPDSVAYFIYSPTHTGWKDPAFALEVGNVAGEAQEINFAAGSVDGDVVGRKVMDGKVTVEVGEKPRLVLVREGKL
ncbi:hypothetical protein [Puia dinghuensis]|uniref:Uncharacterized protein n=1 Tax=Puia dinghuensis TaxID=1792502 RepID=A0A8J2U9Q0_9BACT|nr:hypothetical protein [Puia dinghuensis]GGA88757.1 hypothetical protein GCM10011511_09970 [Puia dinghuensis]